MRYCITTEEVQWVMKYYREERNIAIKKPTKDKQTTKDKQPTKEKQQEKGKQPTKEDSSWMKITPTTNTRTTIGCKSTWGEKKQR